MLKKFENHINKNLPFLKGSKLLLTVSGGIDSVILTHLFYKLDYNISIAHCNFCLRGIDADHDQQSVKNLSEKLSVPFFSTSFDTQQFATSHKLSIQEAARNLRYKWFNEVLKEQQLDYIITAHNLNDNLETFLINLSRGTGLKGLTGIPMINKNSIRPLMPFTRKEITTFAKEHNIEWREDKSNADTKYTRNKIRHKIIPVLEELNPNLLESFKKTLENLQGSQDIITDCIKEIKPDNQTVKTAVLKFDIDKLKNLTNPKAYIHELFASYNFTNFNDIVDLLNAQSGKQVFSKTHRLIKDRTVLLLEELKNKENEELIEITENDSFFKIQEAIFSIQNTAQKTQNSNTANFDKDLLKFPLTVRKWQKGDYFYPIGMRGKKKLSKYFKDEKMSLIQKENIWLLLSDNKVVWIIGKRQDERFKITTRTKNRIHINKIK